MNAAQFKRVQVVFADAIKLPEQERIRFIQHRCGDDPTVLQEVRSLLKHHVDATLIEPQPNFATREKSIVVAPNYEVDPYLVLSDVAEDNRQILRRRLMIIATVLLVVILFSFIRLFTYHHAAFGYGVRIGSLLVIWGCLWALRTNRDLRLDQIRIAEALIGGSTGVTAAVIYVRLMLDAAAREDTTSLISINNWNYFAWALLILIYGVFMPNHWQRAAAILIPIAFVPTLVTWTATWIDDQVRVLLAEDDFGHPIPAPLFAAGLATYAAHFIHGARLSAFQARRLAQYRITRLIGEGGMGMVYEARHLLLKRDCAIKLLQPDRSADDAALLRFEREVRATAKLSHPHTIEVYDYGQTSEGVFFFAMELLPGMNLRELVKTHGPLPAARAIHFLGEVSEALIEAHAAGLVHRDIKPANIFASQRGGIWDFTKLLDFGIVREVELPEQEVLGRNLVAGSPSFMSPEQVTSPDQVDARSDLYSLAAVAYYLLSGRPPFVADSPLEVMQAQVNWIPDQLSVSQPGIPADLEAVVMRGLAKNPMDRASSAAVLLDELRCCHCFGQWTQAEATAWWSGLGGPASKD